MAAKVFGNFYPGISYNKKSVPLSSSSTPCFSVLSILLF